MDTTGWSDLDYANVQATGLHRCDGFSVTSADGIVGQLAIALQLGGKRRALARIDNAVMPRGANDNVVEQQRDLACELLGYVCGCLNNGYNPYALLNEVCRLFREGDLPVGLSIADAVLIDIRDDVDGRQRHYRLHDGRVLIWTERLYVELLSADDYAALLREEQEEQ
jgi:hypothetical protein